MTKIKIKKNLFIAFILEKWMYCKERAKDLFLQIDY
jgi:hypothetical protein